MTYAKQNNKGKLMKQRIGKCHKVKREKEFAWITLKFSV